MPVRCQRYNVRKSNVPSLMLDVLEPDVVKSSKLLSTMPLATFPMVTSLSPIERTRVRGR